MIISFKDDWLFSPLFNFQVVTLSVRQPCWRQRRFERQRLLRVADDQDSIKLVLGLVEISPTPNEGLQAILSSWAHHLVNKICRHHLMISPTWCHQAKTWACGICHSRPWVRVGWHPGTATPRHIPLCLRRRVWELLPRWKAPTPISPTLPSWWSQMKCPMVRCREVQYVKGGNLNTLMVRTLSSRFPLLQKVNLGTIYFVRYIF